jgi:hypothetical protein
MKLISMTDFVLEHSQNAKLEEYNQVNETFVNKVISYANFLKTPLSLGMFVPCDEDNKPLNEPSCMYIYKTQCFECTADEMYRCRKYLEAKEKVIFPNFELTNQSTYFILTHNESGAKWLSWNKSKKVEDLIEFYVDCAVSF